MLEVAVGSFNFVRDQDMLRSRKQKTVHKHCQNFGRVCGKLVEEGELDIMFGCEVGGARASSAFRANAALEG